MVFNLAGTDWVAWFYQKELGSLYATSQHYPPFVYVAIYPLTFLSPLVGYLLLIALSLVVMYLCIRSLPKLILLSLCLPVTIALSHGNVDALLSVVFLLPMSLSALVIACKPQALVLWWMRKWLVRRRWVDGFLIMFAIMLSFVVWGWWPSKLGGRALGTNFLITGWWPWTVPLGMGLLLTKRPMMWLIGGVLVVPYLQVYHLTPILVYVYKRCGLLMAATITILSWAIGIYIWG